MYNSNPIGIFDSGVGGLTVARAIKDLLPHESLYYIGDTANLPYGDKTTKEIKSYVNKIANVLVAQNCKVIIIACNTATAAAAETLQQFVGPFIPVLNVVDPVVTYIKKYYAKKILGLIGTQYTVQNGIYNKKLQDSPNNIVLKCMSTPLLAPMIEEATYKTHVLESYLSQNILQDIDALILGCTHYWVIKKQIEDYYNNSIEIINGAELLAVDLQKILLNKKLNNPNQSISKDYFRVTKLTSPFTLFTQNLFGETVYSINLE